MRKLWGKSSKRRSLAASLRFDLDTSSLHSSVSTVIDEQQSTATLLLIRTLIKDDYDSLLQKHGWLNVVLNVSSLLDISEQAFRLYRVELRGACLYIYRPPLLIPAKLFRPDLDAAVLEPVPLGGADSRVARTMETRPINPPPPKGQELVPSLSPSMLDASRSFAPLTPDKLSYFLPTLPHPELHYDFQENVFLPGSLAEALAHFYLFADQKTYSAPIKLLFAVFPMLTGFGGLLRLIHTFLTAINAGRFGNVNIELLAIRVVHLFEHIDKNFGGFLLRSDVAPHILQILELLQTIVPVESQGELTFFKTSMLSKQQQLLSMVGLVDSAANSGQPFELSELSSHVFMNDISLFSLAATITTIDLEFFNKWNASIDKSLLLYLAMAEGLPGNHFYKKNPLFFNNDFHLHYLSRLLVHHLFVEDPSFSNSKRAKIIERWIDLGCLLDKTGNMSSWLGISSIILSQPVLRLTLVWALVSQDYIKLLKNDWSPVLFELDRRHLANSYEQITFTVSSNAGPEPDAFAATKESYHIMAPRGLGKIYPKEKVIPYFGDLLINNSSTTTISDFENVWRKVNFSFDRWNDYLLNLFNASEIINYNQDVLRRYNSMGFVFSNESLNQVFYLGLNKDDEKAIPALKNGELGESKDAPIRPRLKEKLLRLLDFNTDSISLERVMKFSLELEPTLPEGYLAKSLPPVSDLHRISVFNLSNSSLGSNSDKLDVPNNATAVTASDKLPAFNNNYYKIDLEKYDDSMTPELTSGDSTIDAKGTVSLADDLILRVDDFVPDFEAALGSQSVDDSVNSTADDDGLGINVDAILSSDKFKDLSLADVKDKRLSSALDGKHRSFGLISNSSGPGKVASVPKFIPKLASIDKLIDLLLLDSKYFDEKVNIDLTEYRFVFMLNYSSFILTKELLEKLAHRFVHSGNAVISVMKRAYMINIGTFNPASFGDYPNWEVDETIKLSDLGSVDYELLLKIQVNILKALIVLISNFFQCFFNDLRNKKIMIKLLKLYSNEILQWYNSNKIDSDLNTSFEELVNYYKRLKKLFVKKSYRPMELPKFNEFLVHEFKFTDTMHEVPMNRNLPSFKNVHKIEKFLNKFNRLLTLFYKGITPENWFKVFKTMENLYANHSLLNYDVSDTSIPEDSLPISNIFTYFETLRDSNKALMLSQLPVVFQKLFLLHRRFRTYILIQLCDVHISNEERFDRMKTLLIMLKISKLKMSESHFVFEGTEGDTPSCIESAIVNAVYSPESRVFAHLWIRAAASLDTLRDSSASFEDVESLLPSNLVKSDLLMGNEPLLPCFGWIIENLLDINRCPSYLKHLINFNKRYFVYKLVRELSIEEDENADGGINDTKEFEFLMRLNESLHSTNELRQLDPHNRAMKGIFNRVLRDEYVIIAGEIRKKKLREQKLLEALNNGLSKRSSTSNLRRQSLSYKTNSSSRFKISGLFNKGKTSVGGGDRVVAFEELPDVSLVAEGRQRPAAVVQLKDAKIFPVYLMPFCFKVDGESANDACVFQAPNDVEVKAWLSELAHASRHWFYSRTLNQRNALSYNTFGVPLQMVCTRDGAKSPAVLANIYLVIEKEGLKDVGIYRISTSISELNSIKFEIDRTGTINFEERGVDVHALTSCVKLYFRELPDAVLTDDVIGQLCKLKEAALLHGEKDLAGPSPQALRKVIAQLPVVNYHTVKELTSHLNKVVKHNEHNKMTASNLATVIGPALTEASTLDTIFNNFGVINLMLERLIDNYDVVFLEDVLAA